MNGILGYSNILPPTFGTRMFQIIGTVTTTQVDVDTKWIGRLD